MKKLVSVLVIFLVVAGIVAWLALNLRAKGKYDKVRTELTDHVLSAVPMDAEAKALLIHVRTSWTQQHSETGGPHSTALKTLGLSPSVSNLVHVFTYRLPAYSFVSIDQNKTAALLGVVQGMLMPGAIDGSIHVSDDGKLALVQVKTNGVMVFADEDAGLREESYYVKAKSTEQTPGGDAPHAAP